jgi:single-strand DNA-binding protein
LTFYNKVILIGILAQSPDTRYTPSGSQVTKLELQIAPDDKTKEGSDPQILEVIAIEKGQAQRKRSLAKGCRLLVEGRLHPRRWETMDGQKRRKLEIIADWVCPLEDGRAPDSRSRKAEED